MVQTNEVYSNDDQNHYDTLSLSKPCTGIEKKRHTYVTLALLNEFANVKTHDWS